MIEFKEYIHKDEKLEKAIIGAILLEKFALSRIIQFIDKYEIFYYEKNQKIFEAILQMNKQNIPIDLITVIQYMCNKMKLIKFISGEDVPYYVITCTNNVVSTAHLEIHSIFLMEMFKKREIISIKYEKIEEDEDAELSINNINSKLNNILGNAIKKDWYSMDELVIELYKHQDKMKKSGGVGVLTGIEDIDTKHGGFMNGSMITIGARPSVGKTALSNTIAYNAAKKGNKVGIITLEMSIPQTAARIAALDSNTDYGIIYRNLFREQIEMDRVYDKLSNSTINLPIFVSDKTDVDIHKIRQKAERLKAKEGCDILIIDYLQLINGEQGKNQNRENVVSQISRGIKIMAKELDIPVIVLAQLNRDVTKRKGSDKYPVLSDLRESGALEQDSDVVLFIHSDFLSGELHDENGFSTEFQRDLVVRKWRDGETNYIIPLNFNAGLMKITQNMNKSTTTHVEENKISNETVDYTQNDIKDLPF